MGDLNAPLSRDAHQTRWVRAAVATVLLIAALDWVGWATGVEGLTRIDRTWPPMVPWTALWLAGLGVAVLAQSGQPSRSRVWVGRGIAAVVGTDALAVLGEHVTTRSLGLDALWFGETVRRLDSFWPGRPSLWTASAVVLLAAGVVLTRMNRPPTGVIWPICLLGSGVIALISGLAYLFETTSPVILAASTDMAISTVLSLLLLAGATAMVRPDWPPLAWLLTRADGMALVRLYGLAIGFVILAAVSRRTMLAMGRSQDAAFALALVVGTALAVVVGFRLRHQEQSLLVEKEQLARERAEAEMRYRILADNAVDIIVHLHGSEVAWISPSVEAALGGPLQRWLGPGFRRRIHPDDLESLAVALQRMAKGESVLQRFRVRSLEGNYHWIDGHGKPYMDADGHIDGQIAALRIADERVRAEQQLERLARFDSLTGLLNRAEAIARLEAALKNPRTPGPHLGILFCDIDHFKTVNDTWGHTVGDIVLSTLAERIRETIRQGDTVGRMGGDEMLVLLPNLHSLDEAAEIGEKIRHRAAEPIRTSHNTIRVTLSIGATIAVPGESVTSLTARADEAMYQAKSRDRNAVIRVEPSQHSQPPAR